MTDTAGENQEAAAQGAAPFRFILTPNRSLSPRGFLILMGMLGFASIATGLAFALMGAWPVLGFFGIDVLIVYVAFKLNYRAGRLLETIDLSPEALTLIRIHPNGRRERFDFHPYWVQVRLKLGRDGRSTLHLRSHGRDVAFGIFLADDEQRSFADALKLALFATRSGS